MSLTATTNGSPTEGDERLLGSVWSLRALRLPAAVSLFFHAGFLAAALLWWQSVGLPPQSGDFKGMSVMLVDLAPPTAPSVVSHATSDTTRTEKPSIEKGKVHEVEVAKARPLSAPVMKKPLAEITESGQQARIAEKHATSTAQSVAATSVTQSHPSARRGVPGGRVLAANTTAGELYFIEPRFRAPPRPPVYPRRARQLEQEGEALIRVKLDPRGNAAEVLVWKSSGFALLDAAAMTAVRGWRFVPAHRDGKAIVAWVEIPVRFALN